MKFLRQSPVVQNSFISRDNPGMLFAMYDELYKMYTITRLLFPEGSFLPPRLAPKNNDKKTVKFDTTYVVMNTE